jgi:serine phosphatase RsbU (regulator of sigma subunit)
MVRLNDYLCHSKRLDADDEEGFVCLSLVLLDTETGEATFVVAGAEPPLLLRADGSLECVEVPGLPLGIFPNHDYAAKTLHLEAGDTIVLVTDGLTEARRGNEFLEFEGLAQLAKEALKRGSIPGAAEEVLAGAKAFANGKLHDDACLLLARFEHSVTSG